MFTNYTFEEIRDISGHTFKADAYCRVVVVVEGEGGGRFNLGVISTNSQSRYLKSFFLFFSGEFCRCIYPLQEKLSQLLFSNLCGHLRKK